MHMELSARRRLVACFPGLFLACGRVRVGKAHLDRLKGNGEVIMQVGTGL